jgi:hypothetical protein
MPRGFVTLAFVVALSGFAACGGRHYWSATATQGQGVRVDPMQAWVAGGKLWLRTTVFNGTSEPIRVIRDDVACVLPSGQRVGRAAGTTTVHTPYVLPPGQSHAVYVEFEGEGFDWSTVPEVKVDFSHAVFRGEQPVSVAPMVVTNPGGE